MLFLVLIGTLELFISNCNAQYVNNSTDPTDRGWLPDSLTALWTKNNQTDDNQTDDSAGGNYLQRMLGGLLGLGQKNNQTWSTGGNVAQGMLSLLFGLGNKNNQTGTTGGSDVQGMLGGHTGFGDVIVNVLNRINVGVGNLAIALTFVGSNSTTSDLPTNPTYLT